MPDATADEASLIGEIKALLGQKSPPEPALDAVNRAMIRHWCVALSEGNPLYVDEDAAGSSVHAGIVAPPAMLDAWTMRPRPLGPASEILQKLDAAGYTSVVATNSEHVYERYLRPGDQPIVTGFVADLSDEKQTALGRGRFFTTVTEVSLPDGTAVGQVRMRILKFKPGTGRVATAASPDQPAAQSSSVDPELSLPVFRPAAPERREKTLSFDDVQVGDELPLCPIPITVLLIVAGAVATRDFTPVHHDPAAARAQGSPDIFMNILTTNGLVTRYVTDWVGPEAILKKLSIRLGAPNYPGDTMTFSGRVSSKETAADGGMVEVEVGGRNSLGFHVTGKVSFHLPDGRK